MNTYQINPNCVMDTSFKRKLELRPDSIGSSNKKLVTWGKNYQYISQNPPKHTPINDEQTKPQSTSPQKKKKKNLLNTNKEMGSSIVPKGKRPPKPPIAGANLPMRRTSSVPASISTPAPLYVIPSSSPSTPLPPAPAELQATATRRIPDAPAARRRLRGWW